MNNPYNVRWWDLEERAVSLSSRLGMNNPTNGRWVGFGMKNPKLLNTDLTREHPSNRPNPWSIPSAFLI